MDFRFFRRLTMDRGARPDAGDTNHVDAGTAIMLVLVGFALFWLFWLFF